MIIFFWKFKIKLKISSRSDKWQEWIYVQRSVKGPQANSESGSFTETLMYVQIE